MLYKCYARLIFPFNYSQIVTSPYKVRVNPAVQVSFSKSQILIWMSSAIFRVKCMAPFLQTDGILTAPQPHYKNRDSEGCSRWRHLRKLEYDRNYWLGYKCCDCLALRKGPWIGQHQYHNNQMEQAKAAGEM